MQFIPIFLIMIPILSAMVIYLFKNKHVNYLALVAQFAMTILAIVYYSYFRDDLSQTMFVFGDWNPRIGISLINDAVSMSFIFLSIFMWWMVLIYTFDKDKTDHNFLFFLMFLQGVFLGILQTNDLFNMFVFVELTTILVTIMIAYKKSGESFKAAIYYLLLNTSGVLAFLIGIIFVYFTFGTINVSEVTAMMDDVVLTNTTLVRYSFVLMMAGISVKSALFPLFTWLPKAHGSAHSAISALLSGLVVKGGLFLFIRINAMFAPAGFDVANFFFVVGALTAIIGIVFAIAQQDLKQMLAYSTVSQVGLIVVGLSSAEIDVYYGGILHIFNHALFKALLFMSVGVVIKVYRTKYIHEIRGMFKAMPVVSITMIIGMLAITGAPLFNGFISKSVIIYGFQDSGLRYWTLFIMNIGTAVLFVKMSQIFFGQKTLSYPRQKRTQNSTLMVLALSTIVLGNFYIPLGSGFFGIDLSSINQFTLSAFFDYGVTLVLAFIVYWILVKRDQRLVRKIRGYTLSFETANFLFIAYIVVMIGFFIVYPQFL